MNPTEYNSAMQRDEKIMKKARKIIKIVQKSEKFIRNGENGLERCANLEELDNMEGA